MIFLNLLHWNIFSLFLFAESDQWRKWDHWSSLILKHKLKKIVIIVSIFSFPHHSLVKFVRNQQVLCSLIRNHLQNISDEHYGNISYFFCFQTEEPNIPSNMSDLKLDLHVLCFCFHSENLDLVLPSSWMTNL